MIKTLLHKILNIHPEALSFKQGFDLTELPIVTFYQKDKKLNFLLDTGSNDCVIDEGILKSIEHAQLSDTASLYGIEGNTVERNKCSITIEYKEKKFPYEYIINDMSKPFGDIKKSTGVTLHGIIGSKFFHKFKYVLDFDELIAYNKK